jgi:peptide-methionine (S)-S-oxide reductase
MDYPYFQGKRQYRSALFFLSQKQQSTALDFVDGLQKSADRDQTVYTNVEPVTKFFQAEEYHQNFLKNRGDAFK